MHWPLGGEQLGQASEHPSAPTSPSSSISSTAQPASLVQWDDRLPVQRPLASALEPLPRATRTVLAREAARDIGRGSRRAHASASDLTWRSTSSTCWRAPRLPGGRAPALLRPGAAHLCPPPRAGTRGASRQCLARGARDRPRSPQSRRAHGAGTPTAPWARCHGVERAGSHRPLERCEQRRAEAGSPERRHDVHAIDLADAGRNGSQPRPGDRLVPQLANEGDAVRWPQISDLDWYSGERARHPRELGDHLVQQAAGWLQRHRRKSRCAGRSSPFEATARRPHARRARSGDTRQVARCSSSNQTDLPARSESTPQAADRHSTSCRPLPAVSLGPVSRSSGRR